MFKRTIVVHVDFPALADLVAWLREDSQGQIDSLAAKVTELTEALKTSTAGLDQAVTKEST